MKKVDAFKNMNDFNSYMCEKQCICFGAGRKLDEICQDIPGLADRIKYIIDNNPLMDGKKREILGRVRKIYTPDILKKENMADVFLVISSSYKNEILLQLEREDAFKNLEYCDLEDILDMIAWEARRPSQRFRKNEKTMIPKKLHYIWFSNKSVPKYLQNYIDGWKRLCEDYEIICWNEKNYDITKNRYMYQAYIDKKWSFASDYARLDIIYNHGGIYLDTDVELVRRPDELLYNNAFIGFERLSTVNTGSGFGAHKGFPIIGEMRDFYDEIEFINRKNPNEMILCPVYETKILQKHGLKLNGNFQIVDGMSVYPVIYFNAKSLYSDKLKITKETISVHHCTWTWAESKSKLLRD